MAALYRAAAAETLATADLPPFTAVYDRRSGATHLLVEPAPQIIAALGDEPMSAAGLRARLAEDYDLPAAAEAALMARLAELIAAGLVELQSATAA